MSFDMLKTLAQAYREQKKRPPVLPRRVQTITNAYHDICTGEDPWTALGNFTNAWYGYATHMREALISEPIVKPEQETEYTHRWAAFCAASTEYLCSLYNIPCPGWVHDPYYTLETPWWKIVRVDTPSIREQLLKEAPAPFARRNIFCTNRLFQNKYEMYEWIAEAVEQGLTNMTEIRDYARQKEKALHGA